MRQSFLTPNYHYAVKLFFRFFITIWLVMFIYAWFSDHFELAKTDDYSLKMLSIYTNSILVIAILIFFFIKENKNFNFITKESFNFNIANIFIAVLIGLFLGGTLPYIANSAYYLDSTSFFHEFAVMAIEGLANYFTEYEFIDLFFMGFLNTVLFPLFRTLFFIGILYNLIQRDLNVTRTTVQIAIFFVLSNMIFQFNLIDLISLFGQIIVICYLYFRTKSIVLISLVSIIYDLPVYIYSMMPDFQLYPENYLAPNLDSFFYILIWTFSGILGFYSLNIFYKVEKDA